MGRRAILFAFILYLLMPCGVVWADEPINPQAAEAIEKGLKFLASKQASNGSWPSGAATVAVTALSGIALLSAGNTPQGGLYSGSVQRAAAFLVSACDPQNGYISVQNSNMYNHGFATVFLAEVYGMSRDEKIHEALVRAVRLIENTQNQQGGWRYNPVPLDADLSVTICCLMGLRAARNAGVSVSKKTIASAVAYVKGCQNQDGSFTYMFHGEPLKHQGGGGYARTSAGLCSLFYCGLYEGPEIDKGLEYLRSQYRILTQPYFMYAQYYAAQAFHQAGGADWQNYYFFMRDFFLQRQRPDGSWVGEVSPEYETAMALIVLTMPNELLPIFQR